MARKQRSIGADAADACAYWRKRTGVLAARAKTALDTGDVAGAKEYLRRARVAQRALRKWEDLAGTVPAIEQEDE